jgi:hypothetical protein
LCRVDFRASKRNYHNYTAAIVFFFFLRPDIHPKCFSIFSFFFCSKFKFFQINAGTSCPNKRKKKIKKRKIGGKFENLILKMEKKRKWSVWTIAVRVCVYHCNDVSLPPKGVW